MSTFLSAPHPTNKVTIVLPSAQLADREATEQSVSVLRTMTGGTKTHIKSNPRRRFDLTFRLSRMKALELQAFIRIYNTADIRVTLHNSEVWVCKLLRFPLEFTTSERAGGTPGGELVEVTLELSGRPA